MELRRHERRLFNPENISFAFFLKIFRADFRFFNPSCNHGEVLDIFKQRFVFFDQEAPQRLSFLLCPGDIAVSKFFWPFPHPDDCDLCSFFKYSTPRWSLIRNIRVGARNGKPVATIFIFAKNLKSVVALPISCPVGSSIPKLLSQMGQSFLLPSQPHLWIRHLLRPTLPARQTIPG